MDIKATRLNHFRRSFEPLSPEVFGGFGLIPSVPDDAIVKVPGVISGMGIRGLNFPPLPEGIAEMCRRELALSSIIVDTCVQGDGQLALQALLLDRMIDDIDTARAILDDFPAAFGEYLPQFA